MEGPVVSVIVPVYKVEPYLRRCLDSIANQSYHNLEIILIDDGSPDNCDAICDEYAARDDRITVIHQENGGLSAARNAGLDVATGEWISFVDSDDWVSPDFISCMINYGLESKADIVACGILHEEKGKRTYHGPDECLLLEKKEALKLLLLEEKIGRSVCDKLWSAELFRDSLRFPEGHTYEDAALSYQLFDRAQRVVCVPEAYYHYLTRGDSILGDISLKNRLDCYRAAFERFERLREKYPEYWDLLVSRCLTDAVGVWCCYNRNSKEEQERNRETISEIASFAKKHRPSKSIRRSTGLAGRAVLRLIPYETRWSFALAGYISRLYQRRHGRPL